MLKNIKSFLLKNKSFKQTIAKNSFRLLVAEFVSRLFTFMISLRVARSLGVVEFWAYNFVMTYVIFFVLIVDFWLANLTFRELSKDTKDLKKYFHNTLILKLILSIVVLAIITIVTKISGQASPYFSLIIVFFLHAVTTNIGEFVRNFFRPVERMQNEAYLKILSWIILLVSTLWFLRYSPDLQHIFYGFLTASIINLLISGFYVIRHFKITRLQIERKFVWKLAKMAIPFFLWGVFVYFYSDVNVVLLKFFRGEESVGLFSAPYRLLSYVYILFNVFSLAMFKKLVDASKQKDRFRSLLSKFAKYHLFLSIAFFILMFFFSKYIILLLYWEAYLAADILLKILSAIVIFKSLSYVYGTGLTTISKEYTRLYIQIGIAIINVWANLILIPKHWPLGAAYSLAIAEVCLFLSYRFFVYKYTRKLK